jgi:hypothetical protein
MPSLSSPFVHLVANIGYPVLCRAVDSIMHRHEVGYPTDPRGPRSRPGYAVPARHHLIDPIRPTRRHIAISPHGGLYAMPSLCGSAEATRERFRSFAAHSFLTCHLLARTPGSSTSISSRQRRRHWPSPKAQRLGTPNAPAIRFTRGNHFGAYTVHTFATAYQVARRPMRI